MKTSCAIGAVLIMFILLPFSGLFESNPKTETGEYRIINVRIFYNTPAWELAQAVNRQNTRQIAQIAEENPEVLNFQDPLYGMTLLFWAVGMEKYDSARALLRAGADPDIISIHHGGTALYDTAGFSFVGANRDARFVKLLLEYGADPNIGFVGSHRNCLTEIGRTPLMSSIGSNIEKTRALVEAGADINFRTERGRTAALEALWLPRGARTCVNIEVEVMEYAYFLIVEKRADITQPWLRGESREEVAPVIFLREWFVKLDGAGHEKKMVIIEEFARQGVDYWATEIPEHVLERIKRLHPDTWEEYIKRY